MKLEDKIVALQNAGVIAVVRLKDASVAMPLADALVAGGVRALEITMTTPGAIKLISDLNEQLANKALIGVGSVLDQYSASEAIRAGASFVVSPVGKLELVGVCHNLETPVMLGAYTPTEAQRVHESGANFVKLFPADGLGAGYVKSMLAPLPHLRIVPTGGVELGNIRDFKAAGCAAVGVGSSLLQYSMLSTGDWEGVERLASAFVQGWNNS